MNLTQSTRTAAIVSRQRLVGRTNGSSAYLLDLAETMRAAGLAVHLLQPTPNVTGRWPVLACRAELGVFASHRIRGLFRVGNLFISRSPKVWAAAGWAVIGRLMRKAGVTHRLFADRPFGYVVAEPWTEADLRWLRRHAPEADVAIADYMFCAPGFASLPGSPRTAIVMHDLFHSRAGAVGDTVAAVTRDDELAMLARAQAVIAIQASEAAFVAEHLPASEVLLAPMAAAISARVAVGEDDRLLFVGSGTGPNVEGLRWFLEQAWPRLRALRPEIALDVAGTVGWSFAGETWPGVRFLGMIDDLEPLYAAAGVVMSPLTFGSGLKIKLIEAMARGKAIVATPVTLQGVEAEAGDAVVCTDDPVAFADGIARLAGDGAARGHLAEAALAAARAHFGRETCHATFAAWLARSG